MWFGISVFLRANPLHNTIILLMFNYDCSHMYRLLQIGNRYVEIAVYTQLMTEVVVCKMGRRMSVNICKHSFVWRWSNIIGCIPGRIILHKGINCKNVIQNRQNKAFCDSQSHHLKFRSIKP